MSCGRRPFYELRAPAAAGRVVSGGGGCRHAALSFPAPPSPGMTWPAVLLPSPGTTPHLRKQFVKGLPGHSIHSPKLNLI